MSSEDFVTRVSSSFLLETEQKEYFLERSESYEATQRSAMIEILSRYEAEFAQFLGGRSLEISQKHSIALHTMMQEIELDHETEISEAEKSLAADLHSL